LYVEYLREPKYIKKYCDLTNCQYRYIRKLFEQVFMQLYTAIHILFF